MYHVVRFMAAAALIAAAPFTPQASAQEKDVIVFAAASLTDSLDDVDAAFSKETGVKVAASFAASSALAKQIEHRVPADVFISADLEWMAFVDSRLLIKRETKFNFLGNRLVLIAPKASKLDTVEIANGFDIARFAGGGRIAVADVNAVPAGLYAKAALETLGAWAAAEPKLALAENTRAALASVARGEAPIGIVYATDAAAEPNVRIIGVFPEGSYPQITYSAAVTTASSNADAGRYINFLRGEAAKTIFERYGFSYLK